MFANEIELEGAVYKMESLFLQVSRSLRSLLLSFPPFTCLPLSSHSEKYGRNLYYNLPPRRTGCYHRPLWKHSMTLIVESMTTDTSHLFTGIEFTYCVNSVLYVSTMHGKLVVKLPTWSSNRKYQCTINMLSCGQTAVVSQTRASSLPSVRQTRVDTSPTQTVLVTDSIC